MPQKAARLMLPASPLPASLLQSHVMPSPDSAHRAFLPWALPVHRQQGKPPAGPYTCRLFHQGLVLKLSHLSLLPNLFEHLNPVFLPIVTPGPANPLLFGATPPLGDSRFRDESAGTLWADYSGLLKLIIPCRLLCGFQEQTCVEDPAQCQA